jgi:hypothetical protein
MKAKKHLNLSIPLWWPSSPGWRRLAQAMTPHPGTLIVTLLVVAGLIWANSVGALPVRALRLAFFVCKATTPLPCYVNHPFPYTL